MTPAPAQQTSRPVYLQVARSLFSRLHGAFLDLEHHPKDLVATGARQRGAHQLWADQGRRYQPSVGLAAILRLLGGGRLVGIGTNWYVDDLPPMLFMKKVPNSHGFVSPADIEHMWREQFDCSDAHCAARGR
jgi:hypothetical protein